MDYFRSLLAAMLSNKKIIGLSVFLILLISLPVTVFLLQNQQETRQQAAVPTTTPTACPAVATDTILIIDKSSSMDQEIADARAAAKLYVDQAAKDNQNRIGLIMYEKRATLLKPLTSDFNAVKAAIDTITTSGGTCTQCAIDLATTQFNADGRSGIKKAVVLLTDGNPNAVNETTTTEDVAQTAAINSTKNGRSANNTTYFPIGLGGRVNSAFLEQIATIGGGRFYNAPTASDLAAIYNEIAGIVGKGSIGGIAFNDENNNKVKDSSESLLPNWNIRLKNTSGTVIANETTTETGSYIFTGLCDGQTFTVDATPQTGWSQTLPANDGNYTITITNGSSNTNKDFGFKNIPPTPTSTPPSIVFTGNPTSVVYNGSTTLTWSTTNATSCTATNGWTGTKNTSGTQTVSNLTADKTFVLTCTGPGGTTNSSVTIDVAAAPTLTPTPLPPSLTLTAEDTSLPYNGSTTLTWSTTNATSCTATNGWTGTKNTSGTQPTGSLTTNKVYTLTCTGPGGTVTKSVSVNVANAPTLTPTDIPIPTATTAPQETSFDITLFLHGLGNSGDNANPASSLSNKNPIHKERNILVEVFNSNNELLAAKEGSVIYASSSGNFKGTVNFGSAITTGNYTIKIKSDQYLRNSYEGIQTLQSGNVITLPAISMVTGDTNNDNKLNILDYNVLYGCYATDLFPVARSCNDEKKVKADLTDEGSVNHYDLNLFIRELSVQAGV